MANNKELVVYCLRVVAHRCVKEIEDPTDVFHPDIFIIGIWNCLRAFCSNSVFVPLYAVEFDEEIRPILEKIDGTKKLVFDDDIVLALNYLLKMTKTVPKNLGLLINIFPQINQTYDRRVTMMLETYNILLDTIPVFFDEKQRIDDVS